MKTRLQSSINIKDQTTFKVQTMTRLDTGDCVWGTIKMARDLSEELDDNNFLDGKVMEFNTLCEAVEAQELLEEWATLSDVEVMHED